MSVVCQFRLNVWENVYCFTIFYRTTMGVDHGGQGDKSPQNLERGTLMQIVPPQVLSYRYKNERSVALKIRQNPFSAGALPRTPLGELTTLPRPLSRLERGHPSPYPTPLGTDPPSALAMRPHRSPARSTPMRTTCQGHTRIKAR